MTKSKTVYVRVSTIATVLLLIICSVYLTLDSAIRYAVEHEAEYKATQWTEFFNEKIPGLDRLIVSGDPSIEQREIIDFAVAYGDVFRFKLFKPNGIVAFVSDEQSFVAEAGSKSKINAKAAKVYNGEGNNVSLKDGTEVANRPDAYVEAYVQAKSTTGENIGVIEVYVDQSSSVAFMRSTFSWIGYGLPLLCGLIYLVTSLAFILRNEQVRKAEAHVLMLSQRDALTGLFNRGKFHQEFEAYFADNQGNKVGVVFIDVDNFKLINDENGHEAGDEFLQHIALAITDNVRSDDLVARIGGDEFVIAAPDITRSELFAISNRLLASARRPINYKGKTISGHLSVGCYLTDGIVSADEALHAADLALYTAKATGKDAVIEYSKDMTKAMQERRELEIRLRHALENEDFEVHFQPLTNSATRKTEGYEALLRLSDGQGGHVSPARFIPIAEEVGIINEIGAWVLNESVRIARTWPAPLFVSVNLSPLQFKGGTLVSTVIAALKAADYPANRLELEITESTLMSDTESLDQQLSDLQKLGISIAMDDFGTGFSSLGHLWKYGFNKLKIDQSFLLGFEKDPQKLHDMLENIIGLGHKMGMSVTAEGVETEHQAQSLEEMGCDQLQGYLFSRPMPAAEVAQQISRVISRETLEKIPRQKASKRNNRVA